MQAKFTHVNPGDPVSASQFNAMIDEIERLSKCGPTTGTGFISNGAGKFVIQEQPRVIKIGKTTAALAQGASGWIAEHAGRKGAETPTGRRDWVYNRFAAVSISKWVNYDYVDTGFEVIFPES